MLFFESRSGYNYYCTIDPLGYPFPIDNKGSLGKGLITRKEFVRLFDNFFIKKKKSVQPTRVYQCDNSILSMCPEETHPPTHPAHRLFDCCSDGDFWLRTWVGWPLVIPRATGGVRELISGFGFFGIPEGWFWGPQIPCRDVVMSVQMPKMAFIYLLIYLFMAIYLFIYLKNNYFFWGPHVLPTLFLLPF